MKWRNTGYGADIRTQKSPLPRIVVVARDVEGFKKKRRRRPRTQKEQERHVGPHKKNNTSGRNKENSDERTAPN